MFADCLGGSIHDSDQFIFSVLTPANITVLNSTDWLLFFMFSSCSQMVKSRKKNCLSPTLWPTLPFLPNINLPSQETLFPTQYENIHKSVCLWTDFVSAVFSYLPFKTKPTSAEGRLSDALCQAVSETPSSQLVLPPLVQSSQNTSRC